MVPHRQTPISDHLSHSKAALGINKKADDQKIVGIRSCEKLA